MTRPHPLKGLARATRPAAFRRHERLALTRELEELLFVRAVALFEGATAEVRSHGGVPHYYGSLLLSVPLDVLVRDARAADGATFRAALRDVVEGSVRVRLRAMRWALSEAALRLPAHRLGRARCEVRVVVAAQELRVDVDFEVPLGVSSRRAHA